MRGPLGSAPIRVTTARAMIASLLSSGVSFHGHNGLKWLTEGYLQENKIPYDVTSDSYGGYLIKLIE